MLMRRFLTILSLTFIFSSLSFAMPKSNQPALSYTVQGKGTPLVLIHAFPTDQRLWAPQLAELSSHFQVISLNLKGFGNAEQTDGNAVTMSDYADEVKALLDQLHIQKAIIGGESMGGYVTLAFLKKFPEQVEGVLLSDTQSIADSDETKAKREKTAQDILQNGTAHFIQDFMPKALSPAASDETRATLKKILQEQTPNALASGLRGMALRDDTSDILKQTELPVLILTGDQDTLISPQQSQNMHALAKNSRLVIIQSAGHLSNLEQPKQWDQAVIDMFYHEQG